MTIEGRRWSCRSGSDWCSSTSNSNTGTGGGSVGKAFTSIRGSARVDEACIIKGERRSYFKKTKPQTGNYNSIYRRGKTAFRVYESIRPIRGRVGKFRRRRTVGRKRSYYRLRRSYRRSVQSSDRGHSPTVGRPKKVRCKR